MQECCIFLTGFFPLPRLTPLGPKFLYIPTVGADARHRPAGAGACLRGDASIAPYIPFADGTVGRGLDPSYAVCNDGNIYHLLHNKKSYVGGVVPDAPDGACVAAHGGVKTPPYEPMENDIQYQNGQPRTPAGRRGRRPLRTGFRQAMEGKRDAASSLRADDEHRPLHPLYRWYCREGS